MKDTQILEWVNIDKQLPESNIMVLAYFVNEYGKEHVIRAQYAKKFTLRISKDITEYGEYDEETDEYYCTEGWYETNEFEDIHWMVVENITHWMSLPNKPKF